MRRLDLSLPFMNDETGAGTAWWVLWSIVFLLFGGVAVDTANAWRMRTELQATADAAAHAGVIDLPFTTPAKAAADAMAAENMPVSEHGDVLAASEIEFGTWDTTNDKFVIPSGSFTADAIRVTTRRDATNSNELQAYFLRLIGMTSWNVSAQAVAQRYWPKCLNEDALIARHVVDMQSINHLYGSLCIHGNDHVEVNNGNTWDPGVKVTMPHLADFVVPSSDIDTQNPGLKDALGEEWFDPKIVDTVATTLNDLIDPVAGAAGAWPDYIGTDSAGNIIPDANVVQTVSSTTFDTGSAQEGYVYYVTCPGNSLLNFGSGTNLRNMVIITDCRIYTGNNSTFENVILGSFAGDKPNESIYAKAINIGQGNRFGADDNCSTDNNVQLWSGGSIDAAAGVQMYGVQAVAIWDVNMAAQEQGIEGIQILAGHDIDLSSKNAFGGGCSGGVNAKKVPYYRLVM